MTNVKHQGLNALSRLQAALERVHGDDAAILADGLTELADRTEAYFARSDPPAVAALKCENARANWKGDPDAKEDAERASADAETKEDGTPASQGQTQIGPRLVR